VIPVKADLRNDTAHRSPARSDDMTTSAACGRPSSRLTRGSSKPSIGQESKPCAVSASMKFSQASAAVLTAQSACSRRPKGPRIVGLNNAQTRISMRLMGARM
jgi:hypothetical protein